MAHGRTAIYSGSKGAKALQRLFEGGATKVGIRDHWVCLLVSLPGVNADPLWEEIAGEKSVRTSLGRGWRAKLARPHHMGAGALFLAKHTPSLLHTVRFD